MKIFACEFDVHRHESDATAGHVLQVSLSWIKSKGFRHCHIYGMCRNPWQVYIEAPDRRDLAIGAIGSLHPLEELLPDQRNLVFIHVIEEALPDEIHWQHKKPIRDLLHH